MQELLIKITGFKKLKEVSLPYEKKTLEKIASAVLPASGGFDVFLDEKVVPEEEWANTIPTPDSQIVCVPNFGDPISITAAITAASYATVAAAPVLSGLWIATQIVSLGLMIGAGLLVSALTPKPEQKDIESANPIYSWTPHTTAQEGTVWPKLYGKFKSYGNLIGARVTPSATDKYKLVMAALVDYGYGPIENFTDIRINNQPLTNFKNLTIETRKGLLNQTAISFFDKVYKQHQPSILVTHEEGPVTQEVPGDDYDDFEIIIKYGVTYYHKSGGVGNGSVSTKIEARELNVGEWSTVFEGSADNVGTQPFWVTYKASTLGFTVVRGTKYEYKVTKVSTDANIQRWRNDVTIEFVTEISNDALQYPGKALIGIEGELVEGFTGLQDISSVIEGLIVQQWDSEKEEWILGWSDSPGYVALDILTQPVIGGSGTVEDPWEIVEYEGMDHSRVDVNDVYELVQYCETSCPDGLGGLEDLVTFNGQYDTASTVWEALLDVCRISRCIPIWEGSTVGFIIEKPSARVGVLAAGNIVEGSFSEDFLPEIDRIAEIECIINDKNKNYERSVVPVLSLLLDTISNKMTIDYRGLTSRTEAWRLGRFQLRHNELLKRQIKIKADIDCYGYRIGSRFGVQYDVPNWGQLKTGSRGSGRLIKRTPGTVLDKLQLDYNVEDALEYFGDSGVVYEILVRLSNDVQVLRVIQAVDGDTVTVTKFTGAVKPQETDLWVVGLENLVVKDFRLIKKQQSQILDFNLELIEYDATLWDDDQATPLVPNLNVTPAKSVKEILRPVSLADLESYVPQVALAGSTFDILMTTNCKWNDETPDEDSISWTAEDGETAILVTWSGSTYEITTSNTNKKFIFWDPDSAPTTFQSTDTKSTAVSGNRLVVCQNDKGIAFPTPTGMKTFHARLIQTGTITAEDAQIANAAIETAKIKDLAVETLKIKNDAVTVPSSVFTAGSVGPGVTIQSLTVETTGAPLFVLISFVITIPQYEWFLNAHIYIERGVGETPGSWDEIYYSGHLLYFSGYLQRYPHTISITDDPSEGTYTYRVRVTGNCYYTNRSLFILETKK